MKITINCRNLKLTPEIEEYIYKKIGKLEKYVKNNQAVVLHVELMEDPSGKEGNRFVCEITGFAPHKSFRAKQAAHQIKVAIDLVQEKIEEQLRAYKEKFISRREDKTKEIKGAKELEIAEFLAEGLKEDKIKQTLRKIENLPKEVRRERKRKKFPIKKGKKVRKKKGRK